MTIIDKLRETVETPTGLKLLYDDSRSLNEQLDFQQLPVAVTHLAEQGAIADTVGLIHERITVEVIFFDQTEDGVDGYQNEEIIDRCKKKAFAWLYYLRSSDYFNVVQVNSTDRKYWVDPDSDDALLTGFSVSITLEERDGFGKCDV